MTNRNMLSRR